MYSALEAGEKFLQDFRWGIAEPAHRWERDDITTDLVNKINLVHSLFLLYFSLSTCFGRLWARHQEKQLCFCDTWYLLLVVYDSLECWVEFHPATAYFWAITQRELVFPYTDVSGQPIGPIFKLQEE